MWAPRRESQMIQPEDALEGSDREMSVPSRHAALGSPLRPPWPKGYQQMLVAMGCFWGPERTFWTLHGVWSTAVGYAGGYTPNPTYEQVCSGLTGHTEAVLVAYDPEVISFGDLVRAFWEDHDPTQGMRQGNDMGTQYRSALWWYDEHQRQICEESARLYNERLAAEGLGPITTELGPAPVFYYAEPFHQQYLETNPTGYCGMGGTGVRCPKVGSLA